MKTNEFVNYIESVGGFNFNNLRAAYNYDNKNARKKVSFRSWFTGYLVHTENLSRYVANRIADYYNV